MYGLRHLAKAQETKILSLKYYIIIGLNSNCLSVLEKITELSGTRCLGLSNPSL